MYTALLAEEDQPARALAIAPARMGQAGTYLNFFSGFEYPDCAMAVDVDVDGGGGGRSQSSRVQNGSRCRVSGS